MYKVAKTVVLAYMDKFTIRSFMFSMGDKTMVLSIKVLEQSLGQTKRVCKWKTQIHSQQK